MCVIVRPRSTSRYRWSWQTQLFCWELLVFWFHRPWSTPCWSTNGTGASTWLLVPLGRRNPITAAKPLVKWPADDTSVGLLEHHPGDTYRLRHWHDANQPSALSQAFSRLYVELIRNVPPIVFIFVFYFFISSQIIPLLGLDTLDQRLGPTWSKCGGISLWSSFFALEHLFREFSASLSLKRPTSQEIVRSGIQSVSVGQREAAMKYRPESLATDALRCFAAGRSTGHSSPWLVNSLS